LEKKWRRSGVKKPSRAPGFKGWRGTKSRAGLMRFNRTRGVSMGRVADVCRPTPHDDSRNYGEGDSEVKVTRLVTDALRRPLRGNAIRSGTSSQEAARRHTTRWLAVASRAITEAGSTRDGWEDPARPSLDD
jgi:hypothetical protein